MTGFRRVVIILAHLSILASPCLAEGSVRTLFTLRETGKFAELGNIVFESAVLSLEERSMDVITLPEGVAAPSPAASDVSFVRLAEAHGADFILSTGYKLAGDSIAVEFTWFDVSEKSTVIRQTAYGKIDLTLDTLLNDAVKRIVDTSSDRIHELRAAAGAAAATNATTDAPAAGQPGESAAQSENAPAAPETTTESPARPSALDIGLESGVNMLQMSGLSLSAAAMIIPVGIHIGYVYVANDSVELSAGLSGGPAFFCLETVR